jgi:hypothetical protein
MRCLYFTAPTDYPRCCNQTVKPTVLKALFNRTINQ